MVGVSHQVDEGVRQGLQGGGGECDLQAAIVGNCAGRRPDRLHDCAVLVDLAVDGEGLGGCRREHRQIDLGRVGDGRSIGVDRAELEAGCTRAGRGCGKAHLHAVVGRDGHCVTGYAFHSVFSAYVGVHGANDCMYFHSLPGLVLEDDRQLEAVAEIQETRGGRTDHERQARGQAGFSGAEETAFGDCYNHHAVAGQVIRQFDRYPGLAVPVGTHFGCEQG